MDWTLVSTRVTESYRCKPLESILPGAGEIVLKTNAHKNRNPKQYQNNKNLKIQNEEKTVGKKELPTLREVHGILKRKILTDGLDSEPESSMTGSGKSGHRG